jgi:acetyl-CoA carboxylase biotin carboxyl carrier protein
VSVSDLSFGEVGEILQLLQGIDGAEVELQWGDLRIQVRRGLAGASANGSFATTGATATTVQDETPSPQPQPVVPVIADPGKSTPTERQTTQEAAAEPAEGTPSHWSAITAPMAGSFYRAPKPDEPPFVEVGDTVAPGDTVALIDVMKLYTELKTEVSGKVVRIDASDSALVEFGQPLVWIEPA